MSFLSRLFGGKPKVSGGGPQGAEAATTEQLDYKGFTIRAVPYKRDGQFQTAGIIEKVIDGVPQSHRFVRADRSTMVEEVTDLAIRKGKQMIDEQGDGLFRP